MSCPLSVGLRQTVDARAQTGAGFSRGQSLNRSYALKMTIALATVAVLGFAVVAHGQTPTTVILMRAGEVLANGQGRGLDLTIRVGDAILSADRFELEQSGVIRLL